MIAPGSTGSSFPGADPGKNPPELVLPFLEDLAKLLAKYHPEGKVWVSMQGFNGSKLDYVVKYLEEQKPAWLGGIVAGPQTLPTPELRARIPQSVSHARLSGYHAHGAVPVPGDVVGPGL